MNLKKLKAYFFLIAFCQFIQCKEQAKSEPSQTEVPLHYYVMSIGGLILLVASIVIFWFDLQ